MNDEQILKAHMANMPVGDKTHPDRASHDWLGAYLDDNKAALAELAQVISLLPGGATPARRVALFHWAKRMGMRGIVLCRSRDGQRINIDWDFMFTIFIHSPSEAMLCMRRALRMLRATPPAVGQRLASRL